MIFSLKKHAVFLRCIVFAAVAATAAPCLTQAAEPSVEAVKKAILEDPLFLSHLRDRLSIESVEKDGIRSIVRDYLLENPEIIFEMQEALNTKHAQQMAENQKSQAETIQNAANTLFRSADDAVLGNPGGDVTLVEFFDYNCGYCKRSFPGIQAILKKDPNLRFVMKDFPILGPDSENAHRVARAVRTLMPEKYLSFHEKMMTYPGRATEQSALEIARTLGGDEKKIRAAMQNKTLQEPLVKNAEIAYKLGINYTPSYIIGMRVLPGAVKENDLVEIIAEQRKKGK